MIKIIEIVIFCFICGFKNPKQQGKKIDQTSIKEYKNIHSMWEYVSWKMCHWESVKFIERNCSDDNTEEDDKLGDDEKLKFFIILGLAN